MLDALLDVFAHPVSILMKWGHDGLSLFFPPDSGLAWVGSVVLLVITIRVLLLPVGWQQLRSARRTAALRPRLAALERDHAGDRAAYLAAARELHRSEGAGLGGCLPLLAQLPVFLGLYHLLAGFGVAATEGNGVFDQAQVHGFAHATVAGVPLAAAVRSSAAALGQLQNGLTVGNVLVVVLPLLLVAAGAALVNGLAAARRQPPPATDDPLATGLGTATRAMVWLAPVSILAGGLLFPVPLALVVYWAVNGTWTTAQTVLMNRRLDRRSTVLPT